VLNWGCRPKRLVEPCPSGHLEVVKLPYSQDGVSVAPYSIFFYSFHFIRCIFVIREH
jgi:hypothetical protein